MQWLYEYIIYKTIGLARNLKQFSDLTYHIIISFIASIGSAPCVKEQLLDQEEKDQLLYKKKIKNRGKGSTITKKRKNQFRSHEKRGRRGTML